MHLGRRRPARAISSPVGQNALVAAGERITKRTAEQSRRLIQPWQSRAFAYYDDIGEIKYAAQFYSRSLSQLTLYAAEMNDDGDLVPTDNPEALAALERIQDPGGGRANLLATYGRLMFLVGEAQLLVTVDEDGDEQWEMLSTDELRVAGGGIYTRYKAPMLSAEEYREPSDDEFEPVEGEAVAYRLWKRHPRYSALADSPMHGILDLCEEIMLLTQAVRARARSRMAGAGILFVDDKILPPPPEAVDDDDPMADPLMRALIQAMTTAIVDEGSAAAVVPLIMRVSVPDGVKLADMVEHLMITDPTQLYPETGLRFEIIKRIAIGLDMPPEELMGMADANHWCQSEDTEVLARGRGWISHENLAVGDEVYTLNHETGEAEWKPVKSIYRAPVDREPMYAMDSRSHSSLSTPEHRWPIIKTGYRVSDDRRRWTTSADGFAAADRVPLAARLVETEDLARHNDDLVRLVVAFTADGTVLKHDNLRIVKFSQPEIRELRRILTSLFGTDGFREHDHPTSSGDGVAFVLRQAEAQLVLAHCGEGKAVSLALVEELTDAQRLLMLDSCVAIGDGVKVAGAVTLYQADPRRLDAFAYAAHLSGFKVTFGKRGQQTGFGVEPLSWVRWSSSNDTFAPASCDQSLVAYTGVVWCPVTENKTWFARRNGLPYFTGNTGWMIDEQTWKNHLQPIAQQFVSDVSSSYFRPDLKEKGLKDWRRYWIAYDATAIINHPDRTKDAKDLHDRGALSDEALRDAGGFNEDDAPSPAERDWWLGAKIRDASLAKYGIPSIRSGGIEPQPGEIESSTGTVTDPGAADVVPGPPPEPDGDERLPEDVVGSANGRARADAVAARIAGAADLAVLRAREAAGNRLLSLAKRDPVLRVELRGVRTGSVAATLGRDRARALGAPSELEMVRVASPLVLDALRVWGVADQEIARKIADLIERHAARTLYDEQPNPLPAQFANYVRGLTPA